MMLIWQFCRYHTSSDVTSYGEKNVFALIGGPGVGKTSLLTNWLDGFRKENPDVLVSFGVPLFFLIFPS